MKGKNQSFLKEQNTSVVLKLVRANPGISRADIVRMTGLTAPTVSRITNSLIEKNVLTERKIDLNSVGRKPFGLYFNNSAFNIVGIDFSYLHITGALIDLSGRIVKKKILRVNSREFGKDDLKKVVEIVRFLFSQKGDAQILGIGFASPGMIDHKNGILMRIPHFPKLKNVPVKKILEEEFGVHTNVVNDANAEAVGEKHFGAGNDVKDFVLLHLGYGIGMGIVLKGKLYTGNFGVSGEIGHTSIDRKTGKKCDCGNIGCVELYAGLEGILNDISAEIGENVGSAVEVKKFLKNEKVLRILKEKGELIGYVLVNVVNLLAPQKIIVTGSVSSIGDPLIEPMRRIVYERSFYGVGKKIPIVLSKTGKNCTIIGAATTILEYFSEKPYDFI